jgi:hypothetical protein
MLSGRDKLAGGPYLPPRPYLPFPRRARVASARE